MNSGNENVGEATIALRCPLSTSIIWDTLIHRPWKVLVEPNPWVGKGHTSWFEDQKLESKGAAVHGLAPSAFISRPANPPLPVLIRILERRQNYVIRASRTTKPTLKRPCTSVWGTMSEICSERRTMTNRRKNRIVPGS